eukprot:734299_1
MYQTNYIPFQQIVFVQPLQQTIISTPQQSFQSFQSVQPYVTSVQPATTYVIIPNNQLQQQRLVQQHQFVLNNTNNNNMVNTNNNTIFNTLNTNINNINNINTPIMSNSNQYIRFNNTNLRGQNINISIPKTTHNPCTPIPNISIDCCDSNNTFTNTNRPSLTLDNCSNISDHSNTSQSTNDLPTLTYIKYT